MNIFNIFKKKEKIIRRPSIWLAYSKARASIKSCKTFEQYKRADLLIYSFLDLYKDSQYSFSIVTMMYHQLSAFYGEKGEEIRHTM